MKVRFEIFVMVCVSSLTVVAAALTSLTGSIQYSINTVSDRSSWVITPANPTSSKIQIIFTSISVLQAEIRIYDTALKNSGTLVYACASCGALIPPPFESTTGSVTIEATAVVGVVRPSQFALQYIAVPNSATTQLNNTYTKLNMGAAPIRPYLFNHQLPAGYVQKWAIQLGAAVKIIFSFSAFDFGTNCDAQLTIYDTINGASTGDILFQGCRSTDMPARWLYSNTGAALVVLATSSVSTADFQLNYFSDTELYRCGSYLQPAVISDNSMILADGSKSVDLMKFSTDCSWHIASPKQVPVSLIMNRVSLKFGSSVKVYDGTSESETLLWDADGSTLTVPPVITSTKNALYVRYRSDSSNSVRYTGFEGDYSLEYVGSIGSGKGYTQLQMSSALDIHPPGDGVTHTAGITYIWYVAPTYSDGPITFAVTLLKLMQPGDRLTLLEGVTGNTGGDTGGPAQDAVVGSRQVLAVFNGSTLPTDWIRTSGSSATVIFETTSSIVSTGENFKLSYFSDGPNYHCGFTTNPARLTAPSFIVTDGSSSLESAYPEQNCVWEIAPTNAHYVMLIFERFHLFDGSLRIYAGTVQESNLYVEIGDTTASPAPMLIESSFISLVYTTENKVTGYGFALTYYGVANSKSFPGDRVVTLTSSSVVSLSLPLGASTTVEPLTSLKWIVAPSRSSGRIYLALSALKLDPDCIHSSLKVYDGVDISAPLLGQFCGTTLPSSYAWLQTSSQTALLHFETDDSTDLEANFDVSYFSDGPNFHCGFAINPARMTAPSMTFTDGSGSTSSLVRNQLCEWIIEPIALSLGGDSTADVVVVEFLHCDMAGASITLYDGDSDAGDVLWRCDGCASIPGQIISSTNKVFVRFSSESRAPFGDGFQIVYWTTPASSLGRSSDATVPQVLQLPSDFTMTSSASNMTAAFELSTTTAHSRLEFHPFYGTAAGTHTRDITAQSKDGRPSSVFDFLQAKKAVCGSVRSAGSNSIVGPSVVSQSTQRLDQYLTSTAVLKSTREIVGFARDDSFSYENQLGSSLFTAPSVCKYRLNSGTFQAVSIYIENFSPRLNGHLRIYAGLDDQDALLYDSNLPKLYIRDGTYRGSEIDGHFVQSANITAPCGQATIILEVNSTDTGASAAAMVDYSLNLVYHNVDSDNGEICSAYFRSLQPAEEKPDPNIPVYIALGSVFGFSLFMLVFYYAGKLRATQGYLFYSHNYQRPRVKIVKAAPAHPKYSGKWDRYLNKFLRKGECCVCKNHHLVVIRLKCGHALCLEDINGYLESALGDISTFPVKCPMHFQGCDGTIDSKVAKRVLSEPQYNRFIEFCDRALYGDGMRCIFCCNYVNFPENMEHVARVVCPYCSQYFCIRCKKPWHASNRCAVDTYDESLEMWKNTSGAQKCPACKKLIEKDDPDTCNHMVHKITDGIPCIRDRTDFCYCCGEEVTPDYPHAEVCNKSVNHFPDGVFQRCRKIIQREKEAERERLRKIRRMKTKVMPFGQTSGAAASTVPAGTGNELDAPVAGAVAPRSFAITAPSSGNTNLESMWLLEQQYDIEPTPMGSPARPVSRSMASTPTGLMTPSPGRSVVPGTSDVWNDIGGTESPGASNRARPVANGSRNSGSRGRVVPVNTPVVTNSTAAAGSTTGSSAGIAARPFPMLEQQVLYQHQVLLANRARNTSMHGSASSPQLLLGSPQQQWTNRGHS